VTKYPTTRFNSFQAGEIDVEMDPSIVQVQQVQNNPAIVFYHGSGFASAGVLLGYGKNADSPFAEVQVRQALSYARDRDSLMKSILGEYGIATNRIYATGTRPNNPNIKATFDTATAKQLLAYECYASGKQVKLYICSSNRQTKWMRCITLIKFRRKHARSGITFTQ
jgi:peptide/nickel transport system substrate-binding protein